MAVPLYKVTQKSWLGDKLIEPGTIIEYSGNPGMALEPHNDEAKKIKAARLKARGWHEPEPVSSEVEIVATGDAARAMEKRGPGRPRTIPRFDETKGG